MSKKDLPLLPYPPPPDVLDPFGVIRIPRIMHRIWFGPMRAHHLAFGDAVRDMYMPRGWTVHDWRAESLFEDGDAPLREWSGRQLTEHLVSRSDYRAASDLTRYALLARFGGVWIDSDTEPVQPIDDVLRGRDVLLAREGRRSIPIGMLAGVPSHTLFIEAERRAIAAAEKYVGTARSKKLGAAAVEVTGPDFFTALVWDVAPALIPTSVLGKHTVYPYSWGVLVFNKENAAETVQKKIAEERNGCYFIHHWGSVRRRDSVADYSVFDDRLV